MSWNTTLDIGKDPAQIAFGINHVRLSIGKGAKAGHGQGATVQTTDASAPIRQHEKVQTFGTAKLGILFRWIHRYTHNLSTQGTVLVNVALKIPGLQRTTLRKGAGIKVQDGPVLFVESFKICWG